MTKAVSTVLIGVVFTIAAQADARAWSTTERGPERSLVAQADATEPATDAVAPDEEAPLGELDSPPPLVDATTTAGATSEDAPVGDPPPAVGDAPPPPVDGSRDEGVALKRTLPPPDARVDERDQLSRRELRERAEPDAIDIVLGGAAGALGGTAGGGIAMLASAFMGIAGLGGLLVIGSSTVATGGLSPALFFLGGTAGILGLTLAGILFVLSPAIAAVVAGVAILLFAVDAEEGDWRMLGTCAAGIALAIVAMVLVLLSASVGVVLDPCSSPRMFAEAGPDGPSFTPRPALTSTMLGTAIGGLVGSLVMGGAAFALLPVSGALLSQVGVSETEAALYGFGGVVIGFPLGLVIGSAIGGGVGGAVGVALEE